MFIVQLHNQKSLLCILKFLLDCLKIYWSRILQNSFFVLVDNPRIVMFNVQLNNRKFLSALLNTCWIVNEGLNIAFL